MIKACIFDLDGVLVDTAKYHYLSWKKMANLFHFDFDEELNENLKGISRMKSLDLILKWSKTEVTEEQKIQLAHQKNEWYLEYINDLDSQSSLEYVNEFLTHLNNNNIKLAVGSASKNAKLVLDKLKLSDRFEIIVDGTDVKNTKPDPEVFLKASDHMSLKPNECIVFEDSEKGIEAALAGGFKAVGIGEEKNLKEAHLVIPNFKGITIDKLIERLN